MTYNQETRDGYGTAKTIRQELNRNHVMVKIYFYYLIIFFLISFKTQPIIRLTWTDKLEK